MAQSLVASPRRERRGVVTVSESEKLKRQRLCIAVLLFVTVIINYLRSE